MQNNKSQFIVDHYVEIDSFSSLSLVMKFLAKQGILFVVEPWPGQSWRLYVRKDAEAVLKIVEDDLLT